MKAPDDKTALANRPRRPARSIREIRRRQLAKATNRLFDRLLLCAVKRVIVWFGGLLIDLCHRCHSLNRRYGQWRDILAIHAVYASFGGVNGFYRWQSAVLKASML